MAADETAAKAARELAARQRAAEAERLALREQQRQREYMSQKVHGFGCPRQEV